MAQITRRSSRALCLLAFLALGSLVNGRPIVMQQVEQGPKQTRQGNVQAGTHAHNPADWSIIEQDSVSGQAEQNAFGPEDHDAFVQEDADALKLINMMQDAQFDAYSDSTTFQDGGNDTSRAARDAEVDAMLADMHAATSAASGSAMRLRGSGLGGALDMAIQQAQATLEAVEADLQELLSASTSASSRTHQLSSQQRGSSQTQRDAVHASHYVVDEDGRMQLISSTTWTDADATAEAQAAAARADPFDDEAGSGNNKPGVDNLEEAANLAGLMMEQVQQAYARSRTGLPADGADAFSTSRSSYFEEDTQLLNREATDDDVFADAPATYDGSSQGGPRARPQQQPATVTSLGGLAQLLDSLFGIPSTSSSSSSTSAQSVGYEEEDGGMGWGAMEQQQSTEQQQEQAEGWGLSGWLVGCMRKQRDEQALAALRRQAVLEAMRQEALAHARAAEREALLSAQEPLYFHAAQPKADHTNNAWLKADNEAGMHTWVPSYESDLQQGSSGEGVFWAVDDEGAYVNDDWVSWSLFDSQGNLNWGLLTLVMLIILSASVFFWLSQAWSQLRSAMWGSRHGGMGSGDGSELLVPVVFEHNGQLAHGWMMVPQSIAQQASRDALNSSGTVGAAKGQQQQKLGADDIEGAKQAAHKAWEEQQRAVAAAFQPQSQQQQQLGRVVVVAAEEARRQQ